MNKRICIFGILLFIVGILIADYVNIDVMIAAISLVINGLVVVVIGALIREPKAKD